MKLIILFVVALAAPQLSYGAPTDFDSSEEDIVPILRDDRVHEEDGRFNVDVETGNGITLSQGGSPTGINGSIIQAGEYSYTAPDGTLVHVKFVANENGFQPESDLLPVAPEFPHPIPAFVLEQIAFAAHQDALDDDSDSHSDED
ncbi:hypothetical protein Pmani_003005 [Petrolisthes manimaculis]|uniref:Larval cuticle protein LCP-17 n=1 Tax=Petrolisthes manimaculis TaxID=1843537 RepID=A0AAE1UQF5_9EUCA|nr:hypothetical protein Pmani_003005 [Petrolisthes manimaculis]